MLPFGKTTIEGICVWLFIESWEGTVDCVAVMGTIYCGLDVLSLLKWLIRSIVRVWNLLDMLRAGNHPLALWLGLGLRHEHVLKLLVVGQTGLSRRSRGNHLFQKEII